MKIRKFELLVLIAIIELEENAYGVAIKKDLEERLQTTVSLGKVQAMLKGMGEKGYLTSRFGDASLKRGGKRKRLYKVTQAGQSVLNQKRDIGSNIWNKIPLFSIDFNL